MRKQLAFISVLAVVLLAASAAAQAPDGKALYESKCAMCHGKDGVAKPMAKGSADFNDHDWAKATPAEAIGKVVAEGKGKMPKYGDKLSAEEIKAIAAYVKTIASH